MAMSPLNSYLICTTTVVITLLRFLSPASCLNKQTPSDFSRGLFFEEKTRLGSIPPSCHNSCNECHPCTAVQVPTLPGHDRVKPFTRTLPFKVFDASSSASAAGIKYSNYKPLGWKCRCKNRFFNP